ncbi:hypothetical protein L2E82_31617 [Cichorium intybus]|uniref:Uncharacterized protein n=1 Tax=Cichorium intybus TaxID=13427 RepID=A0ACB9BFR6_CICIN|nr:hypothetical protein L2E82_31617 [Cichorium intybus]
MDRDLPLQLSFAMNHFQASLAAVDLTEASCITDVFLPSILHHRRCISRSSSLFLCVRRHQYARVFSLVADLLYAPDIADPLMLHNFCRD